MNPSDKGAIAEAALVLAAARAGVAVLRPLTEGCRYDLAFDVSGALLRVQCKPAARKGEVLVASLGTCRFTPSAGYVRTTYAPGEVDLFGLYCEELDRAYLVPIGEVLGQTHVHLRLRPARNNQSVGVRWASDYEFAGAVAQLGERRHGMAEVRGSSPLSSTREIG